MNNIKFICLGDFHTKILNWYAEFFWSNSSLRPTHNVPTLNYLILALDTDNSWVSRPLFILSHVDVVVTNFSKTFDKMDHNIALIKYEGFDMTNDLISVFQSYLSNWLQHVRYNEYKSSSYKKSFEVLQGFNSEWFSDCVVPQTLELCWTK